MLFSSRSNTHIIAAYEVSSCSVGGAHALLGPGRVVKMVSQARSHVPFVSEIEGDRLLENAVAQLEKVVATVQKNDNHHPSHVQLVLASPWYFSQTRKILYKKTVPFTFTKELLETLVGAEIQHITTNEASQFGSFSGEYTIVDKQISQIVLNGYPTDNPYGKKVTEIEIGLIVTVSPKAVVDRLVAVLERAYGPRTMRVAASPYVSYVALRDTVGMAPDSIVIDVGEEITDVAFIKNDLFLYQHSFPVGTHGLYRALQKHTACSDSEVAAFLRGFRLGKLAPSAKKSADRAIRLFVENWRQGMREVVDEGHFGFVVPSQCFVVADSAFEQLFMSAIQDDIFIQHNAATNVMVPSCANQDTISGIVTSKTGAMPDVSLGLATIFVERLLQ